MRLGELLFVRIDRTADKQTVRACLAAECKLYLYITDAVRYSQAFSLILRCSSPQDQLPAFGKQHILSAADFHSENSLLRCSCIDSNARPVNVSAVEELRLREAQLDRACHQELPLYASANPVLAVGIDFHDISR